ARVAIVADAVGMRAGARGAHVGGTRVAVVGTGRAGERFVDAALRAVAAVGGARVAVVLAQRRQPGGNAAEAGAGTLGPARARFRPPRRPRHTRAAPTRIDRARKAVGHATRSVR